MADRIARIAGAFVLAMTVTGTSACRGANDGNANSILASMDGAASVSTAIVRAIDGAVVDDYVVQTLSRSSGPIGGAQPCVTAANRTSQRPSALVNPPYAEASILQRDRAMRALGAYAFLLVTVARNDASADSAFAQAEFERASFALSNAANVHAQGDLFIEDRAAALATLARDVRAARDRAALHDVLLRSTASMQQLIAILRADAAKRRLEAIAATQLEIRDLLAYRGSGAPRAAVPCSQPPIAGDPAPSVTVLDRLTPAIRARVVYASDRARALASIDLEAVFEALLESTRGASTLPAQTAPIEDARKRLDRAVAAAVTNGVPLFSTRL